MVVIRFARIGKKKQAFYRVVVADSKRPVTAKFIKILGWYNPHTKELNLKKDELADWLSKGARPSNSLAILLKKDGVKLPEWVKIKEKVSKPKKEEVPEEKKEQTVEVEEVVKEVAETPEEASSETKVEEADKKENEEEVNNSSDGEPSTEDK
jgi:small subunit ribosomal protein S16